MGDACKEIKLQVSISDLAERLGLEPINKVDHFEAHCPACGEIESRHLYLYPDNRYHCFKCKSNGDLFDLYRLKHGCSTKDAITDVKKIYHYTDSLGVSESPVNATYGSRKPVKSRQVIKPKSILWDLNVQTVWLDLVSEILTLTDTGFEYLCNRGMGGYTMDIYGMVSIDDPQAVKDILLKNYDLDLLLRSGLFVERNGKPLFVFYQPCIVFPNFGKKLLNGITTRNLRGKVKSFKLANIPTPIYEGSVHETKDSIYVFEGIFNALSFRELTGSDSFIAVNGLISPSGYDKLKQQYEGRELILCMDNDQAGRQALDKIEDCKFINWNIVAQNYGFSQMPKHPDGKAYDLNDLLIEIRRKA